MRAVSMLLSAIMVFASGMGAAQAPQRPAQPAQPQRDAGQVTVKNEGEITLYELYVARGGTGVRNWGPDRLGDRVLEAGREFTVRLGPNFGCLADIRFVFEDGAEEIRERVDICRERVQVAARAAPVAQHAFVLRNETGLPVMQVFGREPGASDWGPDRLGASVLDPGESVEVVVPSRGCEIDLLVVYGDRRAAEERRGIDACSLNELVLAPGWLYAENPAAFRPAPAARGPRLALTNRSGRTVFAVHVFPDGAADEGPDRLGMSTLGDGETTQIALEPAPECRYTLRITYADGAREERRGIDACRVQDLAIAPGWREAPIGGVRFVNAGPLPVVALFIDQAGSSGGPDRRGEDVIVRGGSVVLAPPDETACAYDVRAVFRDGREVRLPLADLCSGTDIVLSP